MQTAFKEMKVKLTSAKVLSYSDYEKAFVVCTDASSRAVGAVLSQADQNRSYHPIHYASRALSAAESSYSAFEREAIDGIFTFPKFRHNLTSNKFELYTDHQALNYALNMKDPHGRIAR